MSDSTISYEVGRPGFVVSCDPGRLDLDYLYEILSDAYWHKALTRARLQRSIDHSIAFGLYASVDGGRQIGFARVSGDRTYLAYTADVFVDRAYRGLGLGRWLMDVMHAHPDLQGLRHWLLRTRDAHRFYEVLGYVAVGNCPNMMVREP